MAPRESQRRATSGRPGALTARLRLYGRVDDAAHVNASCANGSIGDTLEGGRWLLTGSPEIALGAYQPIAALRVPDTDLAARLRYDISGWAVLEPVAGTVLVGGNYCLNIRSGLTNHFYLSGTAPVSNKLERIVPALDRQLNATSQSIADVGLSLRAGSLFVHADAEVLDLSRLEDYLREQEILLAQSSTVRGDRLFLIERRGCRVVLTISLQSEPPIDDLAWYRLWLASEGMRATFHAGQALLASSRIAITALDDALEGEFDRKDHLTTALAARRDLLNLVDSVQDYDLMIRTVRDFRSNIDLAAIEAGSLPAASEPGVLELLDQDYRRLYAEPAEAIGSTMKNAVSATELRLSTMTELEDIRFNTSLQVQLKRIQWIMVVLAVATLVVGLLTVLPLADSDPEMPNELPTAETTSTSR